MKKFTTKIPRLILSSKKNKDIELENVETLFDAVTEYIFNHEYGEVNHGIVYNEKEEVFAGWYISDYLFEYEDENSDINEELTMKVIDALSAFSIEKSIYDSFDERKKSKINDFLIDTKNEMGIMEITDENEFKHIVKYWQNGNNFKESIEGILSEGEKKGYKNIIVKAPNERNITTYH